MTDTTTRTPALDVEGLRTVISRRRDQVCAVDGVSFTLNAGETLALVGESGSGKSMTALSIMRLLPPNGRIEAGRITLGDTELTTAEPKEMAGLRADRVAMVFQDPLSSLNPTMTVGDQVAETIILHRSITRAAARAKAVEVLASVGIPDPASRCHQFPHQLSGGLRQRVAIGMAVACEPQVLIADEPTTALDVTTQAQILELFDSLKARTGMGLILITHDLAVVAGRADRVAVMYAGKIVEEAAADELFARPRHQYTEALLRATPSGSHSPSTRLANIPGLPPDLSLLPRGCRFAPRCAAATDQCRQTEPALEGPQAHRVACIHPVRERVVTVPSAAPPESLEAVPVVLSCSHIVQSFTSAQGLLQRRGKMHISAVADVSFEIEQGRTFGLVGESGCGKSSLARIAVALDKPVSGDVVLAGKPLATMSRSERHQARRDLQLVFQDAAAALNPRMRVGAILAEPLHIQKVGSRTDRSTTIARLLDDVGLSASAASRYPHEFSGGQRQRIALARALALTPKVIVADEPVSALDVSVQAQILNLMADLQAEHNLSYLLVSHDLSVVRYLADRIGVMYLGKLVEVGAAEAVYRQPLHHYTRLLIDTAPTLDQHRVTEAEAADRAEQIPSAANPPSGCRFRTRCPRAEEICATKEPPLVSAPDSSHAVACHFPLEAETSSAA